MINSILDKERKMVCGVPRKNTLGLVLFILYIMYITIFYNKQLYNMQYKY